ncbi:DUF2950 domain-containing protein [Chitinibacter fontanus]|uniref:DUF2950 domain-containing protein n=1 Tax=Chitinibacter fontanus TaxID=1737446 RepID=A0A7D5ZH42_9NEIS|nr:DUF2950 domain-containing protein [Chitinibacter fontanus]QLI81809.1 DUF2950 domain-containing protein [Chitinibacter fontanus]
MHDSVLKTLVAVLGATLMSSAFAGQLFKTPEAAGEALLQALEQKDPSALEKIFGSRNRDLIVSGDPIDDQNRYATYAQSYRAGHQWRVVSQSKQVLELGEQQYPFAIPLIRDKGGWVFAGTTGRAELLTRRIGMNELSAIEALKTVLTAQQEYYLMQADGSSLLHYADRIVSSPERKDGLYWPEQEGAAASPMGAFFAAAAAEGYHNQSAPYHGYFFKILQAQGPAAKGGAYSYVESGKMFGGFAVLAWPASYGKSGVMSFITNQEGVIYQRNLGKGTADAVKKLTNFNPDKGWSTVE